MRMRAVSVCVCGWVFLAAAGGGGGHIRGLNKHTSMLTGALCYPDWHTYHPLFTPTHPSPFSPMCRYWWFLSRGVAIALVIMGSVCGLVITAFVFATPFGELALWQNSFNFAMGGICGAWHSLSPIRVLAFRTEG
jgi:hypothetical protein